MKAKRQTTKPPEAKIHDAIVAKGFITSKYLRETIEMLQKDVESIPASIRKHFEEGPTPFDNYIGQFSPSTLATLEQMRCSAINARPPRKAKSTTLPIDPRVIAENDGVYVIGSKKLGRDFDCLIEFNSQIKGFTLLYRLDRNGRLPHLVRLSIARHLGHYSYFYDELKSGAVLNTANLDLDPELRLKATQVAEEILVPQQILDSEIQRLAHIFGVEEASVRHRANPGTPQPAASKKT